MKLLPVTFALAFASASGDVIRAQETGAEGTTSAREWNYPSRGPSRGQGRTVDPNGSGLGPWYGSVSAGLGWFDGDGLSNSADFVAEGRLALDLTDEVYAVGSYTFGLAETSGDAAGTGDGDDETHDLHILALGVGFRLEATPEVQFFVEPRIGVLFGGDADVAPAGLLSGGVELSITEGVALRFAVTGLLTDTDINVKGDEDANLDSGIMATLGVSFEF